MADLLAEPEVESLIKALERPDMPRQAVVAALASTGSAAAREALLALWQRGLHRNELPVAIVLLSADSSTPAGAWSAARLAERHQPRRTVSTAQQRALAMAAEVDFVALRALLNLTDDQGFALLHELSADLDESNRLHAMAALALADRDHDLAADWLRRLEGEVPDPLQAQLGWPLALSSAPAGVEFRRLVVQRGLDSPHLPWLLSSVAARRCPEINTKEFLSSLLDTPEGARRHPDVWRYAHDGLSNRAAQNLVRAAAFRPAGLSRDVALALWVRDSGLDVAELLYGAGNDSRPADPGQLLSAVMFGERERAYEIIRQTEPTPDGSMWLPLHFGRAWLNMLEGDENARVISILGRDRFNVADVLQLADAADRGDARTLRRLLDAHGPLAPALARQDSGAVTLEARRGSQALEARGAALVLQVAGRHEARLPAQLLRRWISELPEDWADFWHCRRALLTWDGAAYQFVELP
jgi:hypothetical protein